ncbi:LysR family transcriptional regulator [Piscinibacter koreensis]|uniref:LysR family transcriptional regulator n=1 Tax=Piscinibacter koreensis TaxID=2742824 RepID=A0A7Y6NQ04_9BURK|nr:LysR family transcriptional regulator [Schlegelella koreensis]NUZ07109.1 LysR family transcriptional regulator [Schlegelella koreensis]
MSAGRNVLTPEALTMMDVIARTGSFAAAARALGKVPSSLTYSVRQLEDALDVLLFDRRSGQARLTAAGQELLDEGRRLLEQIDAVANRVRRVATGWETQLGIALDGILSRPTVLELCEAFYAACASLSGGASGAGTHSTRLKLRTEVLAGTWEALVTGQVDLAIGVGSDRLLPPGIRLKELGSVRFVFAVAPHHPLAAASEPISDAELARHRAVAVADSAQRLTPLTVNLLPEQDVLTVSSMQVKIDAQLRGLGCGFVPEPLARVHIDAGRLVAKPVQRALRPVAMGYAWRAPETAGPEGDHAGLGLALRWWLEQLESPTTRRALLERHGNPAALGLA